MSVGIAGGTETSPDQYANAAQGDADWPPERWVHVSRVIARAVQEARYRAFDDAKRAFLLDFDYEEGERKEIVSKLYDVLVGDDQ